MQSYVAYSTSAIVFRTLVSFANAKQRTVAIRLQIQNDFMTYKTSARLPSLLSTTVYICIHINTYIYTFISVCIQASLQRICVGLLQAYTCIQFVYIQPTCIHIQVYYTVGRRVIYVFFRCALGREGGEDVVVN